MEAQELKEIIENKLKESSIEIRGNFKFGEYVKEKNTSGVYKIHNNWLVYQIDEKMLVDITGPFSDDDIVYAIATILGYTNHFSEYSLSSDGIWKLVHNHFVSYEDANKD